MASFTQTLTEEDAARVASALMQSQREKTYHAALYLDCPARIKGTAKA